MMVELVEPYVNHVVKVTYETCNQLWGGRSLLLKAHYTVVDPLFKEFIFPLISGLPE